MMTNDEFNSWACDIANDYAQARLEMGPDDYISWDEYSRRRLEQCDEAEAYDYVMRNASTPASKYIPPFGDDDDLPF